MFYALQAEPDYWKSKLNLFVALAPVTRLQNTTSDLFKYSAKAVNLIQDAFNFAHVWSTLGQGSAAATKIACGLVPSFCQLMEGFLITHDPKLDDEDRF
jgi:hypothetical protein